MTQERDFETFEIEGLELIRYSDSTALSIIVDLFLTLEKYGEYWQNYGTQIEKLRSDWPTPSEFANESLEYILKVGWPYGLPEDVRGLMSKTRACVFEGHGYQYDDIGWGAHFNNRKRMSVSKLLTDYNSLGYETVMFAVCNPNREHLEPQRGSVIYPVGNFGIEYKEFEMVVKTTSL